MRVSFLFLSVVITIPSQKEILFCRKKEDGYLGQEDYNRNIMGSKLFHNFGAKFQSEFTITMLPWQHFVQCQNGVQV